MKIRNLDQEMQSLIESSIQDASYLLNLGKYDKAMKQFEIIISMIANESSETIIREELICKLQIAKCELGLSSISELEFEKKQRELQDLYSILDLQEPPNNQNIKSERVQILHEQIQGLHKKIHGETAYFSLTAPEEKSDDCIHEYERNKKILSALKEKIQYFDPTQSPVEYLLANDLCAYFYRETAYLLEENSDEMINQSYLTGVELTKNIVSCWAEYIEHTNAAGKQCPLKSLIQYLRAIEQHALNGVPDKLNWYQKILNVAVENKLGERIGAITEIEKRERFQNSYSNLMCAARDGLGQSKKRKYEEKNQEKGSSLVKRPFRGDFFAAKNQILSKEHFIEALIEMSQISLSTPDYIHRISEILREMARFVRYKTDQFKPEEYGIFEGILELYYASLSVEPDNFATQAELDFYLRNEYSTFLNQTSRPEVPVGFDRQRIISINTLELGDSEGIEEISEVLKLSLFLKQTVTQFSKLLVTELKGDSACKLFEGLNSHLRQFIESNLSFIDINSRSHSMNI